jgi:hypothetical protein
MSLPRRSNLKVKELIEKLSGIDGELNVIYVNSGMQDGEMVVGERD